MRLFKHGDWRIIIFFRVDFIREIRKRALLVWMTCLKWSEMFSRAIKYDKYSFLARVKVGFSDSPRLLNYIFCLTAPQWKRQHNIINKSIKTIRIKVKELFSGILNEGSWRYIVATSILVVCFCYRHVMFMDLRSEIS